MKRFDAVVVGCGVMGSSVSYNLAKRGLKVLTLERFGLNHDRGSSHGRTRIIRLAYFEDPRYVPLLRRAFAAWKELEVQSGSAIIKITGGLMIGREDGGLVRGVLRSAKEHALPHRLLNAREAMESLRVLRLQEDKVAVLDENAGFLFLDNCVSSYAELAQEAGAYIRFSEPVRAWERSGDAMEVTTGKEKYSTDKLVFAAGPWMSKLFPRLLPLVCERQVQFWFAPPGDGAYSADRAPVFMMEYGRKYFYGIPDAGDGVKLAQSHGGTATDPDTVERKVADSDLKPVSEFMARCLPAMDRRPIASATCIYTNTPDENFVIDFHPADKDVLLVSACSGHGFKFSSVLGEMAADLLTSGKTELDVSFLRLGRFSRSA